MSRMRTIALVSVVCLAALAAASPVRPPTLTIGRTRDAPAAAPARPAALPRAPRPWQGDPRRLSRTCMTGAAAGCPTACSSTSGTTRTASPPQRQDSRGGTRKPEARRAGGLGVARRTPGFVLGVST